MPIVQEQIEKLYYKDGLSAREIAAILSLTTWQVIRFMRKHNLRRRNQAETHRLQFARSPLSFKKKVYLTNDEKKLKIAGHMLYWAEGSKKGAHTVDFANSDLDMNKLFLAMLRQIYQIDEKRLRILIYCYADQDVDKLIHFWSKALKIAKSQFSKPYVRKDFNVLKKGVMNHGLIHIRYNDKRLKEQIKKEIDIIQRKLGN